MGLSLGFGLVTGLGLGLGLDLVTRLGLGLDLVIGLGLGLGLGTDLWFPITPSVCTPVYKPLLTPALQPPPPQPSPLPPPQPSPPPPYHHYLHPILSVVRVAHHILIERWSGTFLHRLMSRGKTEKQGGKRKVHR